MEDDIQELRVKMASLHMGSYISWNILQSKRGWLKKNWQSRKRNFRKEFSGISEALENFNSYGSMSYACSNFQYSVLDFYLNLQSLTAEKALIVYASEGMYQMRRWMAQS